MAAEVILGNAQSRVRATRWLSVKETAYQCIKQLETVTNINLLENKNAVCLWRHAVTCHKNR